MVLRLIDKWLQGDELKPIRKAIEKAGYTFEHASIFPDARKETFAILTHRKDTQEPYVIKGIKEVELEKMETESPQAAAIAGEMRKRYQQEIDITHQISLLGNPNFVTLEEIIKPKDHAPLIVLEFLPKSSDNYFRTSSGKEYLNGEAYLQKMYGFLQKMTYALDILHTYRIAHNDLNDKNIRLSKSGEPCIFDFGFAEFLTEAAQKKKKADDSICGTPNYFAPEIYYPLLELVNAHNRNDHQPAGSIEKEKKQKEKQEEQWKRSRQKDLYALGRIALTHLCRYFDIQHARDPFDLGNTHNDAEKWLIANLPHAKDPLDIYRQAYLRMGGSILKRNKIHFEKITEANRKKPSFPRKDLIDLLLHIERYLCPLELFDDIAFNHETGQPYFQWYNGKATEPLFIGARYTTKEALKALKDYDKTVKVEIREQTTSTPLEQSHNSKTVIPENSSGQIIHERDAEITDNIRMQDKGTLLAKLRFWDKK